MKYRLLISFIYLLFFSNITLAEGLNCNQFEKLSAKYIECNAKKLKNDTNNKVVEGKKKFNNSLLKEKLTKFKNSENLMDFLKKK
tara:strand:- start:712 stop:966 length:255 start_codon:yes stop_codon:yes gene_type:complete